MNREKICPDCDFAGSPAINRRHFVQTVGAATAGATLLPRVLNAAEKKAAGKKGEGKSETLVQKLYQSLSDEQKSEICFPWDYKDDRGLLRTHVSNNWSITDRKTQNVGGSFYTKDQQELIETIFYGLYNPAWHDRIRKQLKDDAGGYGKAQTIAIFGEPGSGQFEFVMTGRHLTVRCDGDSEKHVAFGGPIFYGHAAQGFNEKADHPGNVFWPQALKANELFGMLNGQQRKAALLKQAPGESNVPLRGKKAEVPGIPVNELSSDQKEHLQGVLDLLLEPYRSSDVAEARRCLEAQGGLDECGIAFYQSGDIGNDGVWDVWRLEGPAFVWHYRGSPHVHVWVNVADDPNVKLNARG